MISTTQIKFLKSLHKKKYRRIENKFLLEGYRIIDQALILNNNIEKIFITKKGGNSLLGREIITKITNKNINYEIVSDKIIHQISDSLNHQGIIALSKIPIYKKNKHLPEKSIYLDKISDPGNMGTILRTAAWFGIKSIFYSIDSVDPFNSKVVRSAMGAHFNFIHLEPISNEQIFPNLKKNKIEIIGADIKGENILSINLSNYKKWCLVLGSESHGIDESTKSHLTKIVCIPGYSNIESLNVSVANGILLYNLLAH